MNLFSRLRNLNPFQLEDFHTEIVVQVLRNSQALTLNWLRGVGVTSLQVSDLDYIDINPQEKFAPLPEHSSGSRPDITIRLVAGRKRELVFIESKVPSKLRVDQLQKYAEQLEAAKKSKALDEVSLIFITRDYEAPPPPQPTDPTFHFTFKSTRWYQFHRYLKAHVNGDGLAKELQLFMEQNNMSQRNQFRSTDLVALENLGSAIDLMRQTLDGEVSIEAARILGGVTNTKQAWKDVEGSRRRGQDIRFVIQAGNWKGITCVIGYWLPCEERDEQVTAGIIIHSASAGKDTIDAFRGWSTRHEWLALDLEKEGSCRIEKRKEISALMGGPDHVKAVKEHFLSLLTQVEEFRNAYPDLPWSATIAANLGDEVTE